MIYSKMIIRNYNRFLLLILLEPRISHKQNYLNKVINSKVKSLQVQNLVKMMMIRLIEPKVHWV